MSMDLSTKSIEQLENLVDNWRRAEKTDSTVYIDAFRRLEVNRSGGLDLEKTLSLVVEAAKSGRFVGYKEVGDASKLEWSKIHWQVGRHLVQLCEYAHRKGLPLLSAVVVNGDRIQTGEMKIESRAGFIEAAKLLGFAVQDEEEFVKAEQAKVFAWALKGTAA